MRKLGSIMTADRARNNSDVYNNITRGLISIKLFTIIMNMIKEASTKGEYYVILPNLTDDGEFINKDNSNCLSQKVIDGIAKVFMELGYSLCHSYPADPASGWCSFNYSDLPKNYVLTIEWNK